MPGNSLASPISPVDNDYRPKVRDGLRFGPAQREGFRTVVYVKDTATGKFYRIGLRESLLLARMDGTRSLPDLLQAWFEETGRHLSDDALSQLFSAVGRFLEHVPGQTIPALPLKEAPRGFLEYRFPLAKPDRVLVALIPWMRFAFHRRMVVPVLLLMLVAQFWIWFNAKTIFTTAFSFPIASWWLPVYFGLFLLLAVAHEMAHGLACTYFGGSVQQMGVMFRYLTFMPYCKLDDVVLFHNWTHRIYVMFAGSYVSLLLLFPFIPLWFVTAPGTGLHYLSAGFLSFYNATILFNLIPFIQLDGYFMLCYHLKMPTLRKDSYQFCMNIVRQLCGKPFQHIVSSSKETSLLISYCILSTAFATMIVVQALRFWHSLLSPRIGSWQAMACLLALMAVMFLWQKRDWLRRAVFDRAETTGQGGSDVSIRHS